MVVLVMTVFDIGDPEDIDLFSMAWRGRAPYIRMRITTNNRAFVVVLGSAKSGSF